MKEKIVSSLKSFFEERGFTKAVIGLSGGIDSAVTACLTVEALGKENVIGIALPNEGMTSIESTDLAEELAKNLGIRFHIMPITKIVEENVNQMFHTFGSIKQVITRENLQSRIRAVILMAVANDFNALLLSTGNETEEELGYCTLYGDSCGAVDPLGHVSKMGVYKLADKINESKKIIPQRIIDRPPTAELSDGQVDPFDYQTESEVVSLLVHAEKRGLCLADMEYIAEQTGVDLDRVKYLQSLRVANNFKKEQSAPPLEWK